MKRILLFFLVFLFSFKLSHAAVDVPKLNNAEEQVMYAYELKDSGKYEQAILAFEKVVEYFLEDTEWCVKAQMGIGGVLELAKNYSKAIDAFSKILKEYPEWRKDCAIAIKAIALIYYAHLKNDEMAIETLKKGIRDYNNQPQFCAESHNFIGMIYHRAGEFQKAAEEFQKTIHSFPNCENEVVDALIHIGRAYKNQYNIEVDYEEAIPPLSKVANDLSLPGDKRACALFLMGDAYKRKGKYQEAIEIFKRIKKEFEREEYQVSQAENQIKECERLKSASPRPKIWKTYTNTSYVNKIYVEKNKIWVGTRGGVRIVDKETLQSKKLNTSNGLLNNDVVSLVGDEDYILASSSWDGISKIDKRTFKISPFRFPTYSPAGMSEMIRIGSTIWMGQRSGWLHKCNISTNKSKLIKKDWGSISDIVVGDNVLWISSTYAAEGMREKGIQAYDFTKDKIIKVLKVENGLPQDENNALYLDKNMLWIGSAQQGLSRYDITNDTIHNIAEIGKCSILTLDGDKENLWVGTNYGLYKLNKKTGQVEKIPWAEKKKVTTIAVDENILWVGTNDGLCRYQPKTDELISVKTTGEISGNNIQAITKQNGSIRVVTEDGISIYDPVTNAWIGYTEKEGKPSFNQKQKYRDKNLTTIGLEGELEIYFPSPLFAKHIFMSCMVEDNLYQWVGTYIWGEGKTGTGLLRIDKKTREIKCYSTLDGLAGNLITCIFIDKEEVWVGTTQGISKARKEKLNK